MKLLWKLYSQYRSKLPDWEEHIGDFLFFVEEEMKKPTPLTKEKN